ncbi:DUF6522 family protein [Lichenihabitans psoromatis]|uniref:DUF6522 family protein n=1 Tax=Lichenihabitans psoromatis TaxID=2528642 RepID=UPI00103554B4|nr:DUF6522 family protein [Lichenihabitans psoromatis]
MQVERGPDGDYLLDPAMLAAKFGLPLERFRQKNRIGQVTSLVEAGEGDDAGTHRLTVRCGRQVWRAVIDDQHVILQDEMIG